ncbi:MAG: lipoprotein-releasing ABC transporter permease subunit [Pseudomonadota bacterium]
MAQSTAPFARYEWFIAWRYLRARRAEGGVSVMTWISLVGITLAVAALIITLAVRAGFRTEFVDTILGANAHVGVYAETRQTETGAFTRVIEDYDALTERLRGVPGVLRAAPMVRGQVMANSRDTNAAADIYGMRAEDVAALPRIANPETSAGDLARFSEGIAIGSGLARELGVGLGDVVRLISPNGVKTAFGTSPRVSNYEVIFIFNAGRNDIDRIRVYMPLEEAQIYFNRDGVVDQVEVMVEEPERLESITGSLLRAAGQGTYLWTWRDSAGAFLAALEIEDNVMFVLMSVLVLIASMNIISGLVMLVKNKGRDIGILRTMGLTEGAVMRVFFICGALVGVIGTFMGVILGALFATYFEQIMGLVNAASGGNVWDGAVRPTYRLPADLRIGDVLKAVGLSLTLSFAVTLFPARRAARLNPVEALRYE